MRIVWFGGVIMLLDQPFRDRIKRYREVAAEAQRNAEEATTPELQRSFRELAASWALLAQQTELLVATCRSLGRGADDLNVAQAIPNAISGSLTV